MPSTRRPQKKNRKTGQLRRKSPSGQPGAFPQGNRTPVFRWTLIPALLLSGFAATLFGISCRERSMETPPVIGTRERPNSEFPKENRVGDAVPPGTTRPVPSPPTFSRESPHSEFPKENRAFRPAEIQMLLGNLDNASGDANNREHFLIQRPQYALSYNDTLRFPNWVAWHLTEEHIGDVERGQFVPDPDLPGDFTRIVTSDYTRSGYDRGHNCPSKDRSATRADNDATFFMTNITPQRHGLNGGPWEGLESYCRDLTKEGNELYITCGHGFNDTRFRRIGPKKIAVPDFAWKVVVALPEAEGNDLARINENTRVIAVMMPNSEKISRQDWQKYIVSVADIERITQLKFFGNLPPSVADALKNKRDM